MFIMSKRITTKNLNIDESPMCSNLVQECFSSRATVRPHVFATYVLPRHLFPAAAIDVLSGKVEPVSSDVDTIAI
jgi:hypothetical protein